MTPQAAGRPANYINHIVIVGDMSPSMSKHKAAFIKVFDNLVAHLADRSRERDQETRISVYLFSQAGSERCVVWDKDVLRMPSIAQMYDPQYYGMTALIDATMLAIGDEELVSQKYGDHAFMTFVITDGEENNSRRFRPLQLKQAITGAAENKTYACFVPNQGGVFEAKSHGFPGENISVWDTTSAVGVERMGEVIRNASDVFMEGRAQGVRGYNAKTGRSGSSLFKIREFSAAEVTSSLPSLTQGSYFFLDVPYDNRIDEFISGTTRSPYRLGSAYYQHTKTETIQPQKEIAVEVVEQAGGGEVRRVYSGRAARDILGLPDTHVKVKPNEKNGCTVFVQSTSPNRKLIGGTRVLVMR